MGFSGSWLLRSSVRSPQFSKQYFACDYGLFKSAIQQSPSCGIHTSNEVTIADVVARSLDLPSSLCWHQGLSNQVSAHTYVGGGGMLQFSDVSCLVASLLAAKQARIDMHMKSRFAKADDGGALMSRWVCYASDQAPPSLEAACRIVGIQRVKRIQTAFMVECKNYALDMDVLESTLAEDMMHGVVPLAIIGLAGSGSACATDPLVAIAALSKKCGAWFHIDGGTRGVASALSPARRMILDGCRDCDALHFSSPHWMHSPCSMLFSRHMHRIFNAFQDPSLGRQSDADMWSAVRMGVSGRHVLEEGSIVVSSLQACGGSLVGAMVEHHISLASRLEEYLRGNGDFEVEVAAASFGAVLFRVRMLSDEDNAAVARNLESMHGIALQCVTVRRRCFLRVNMSCSELTARDVDDLFEKIVRCARGMTA